MRTIKFRAWPWGNEKGEMEYRVMVGYLGAFWVGGMDTKDSACLSPMNTIYGEAVPIMQFTGLLDKNGKEIYEGDIALIPNYNYDPSEGDNPNLIKSVVYFKGKFGIENKAGDEFEDLHDHWTGEDSCEELEIIGNIYENPELIQ